MAFGYQWACSYWAAPIWSHAIALTDAGLTKPVVDRDFAPLEMAVLLSAPALVIIRAANRSPASTCSRSNGFVALLFIGTLIVGALCIAGTSGLITRFHSVV